MDRSSEGDSSHLENGWVFGAFRPIFRSELLVLGRVYTETHEIIFISCVFVPSTYIIITDYVIIF